MPRFFGCLSQCMHASKLKEGYWREHIERNRKRDRAVNLRLRKEGYIVLRFWNDQIEKEIDACVATVKRAIQERARKSFIRTN